MLVSLNTGRRVSKIGGSLSLFYFCGLPQGQSRNCWKYSNSFVGRVDYVGISNFRGKRTSRSLHLYWIIEQIVPKRLNKYSRFLKCIPSSLTLIYSQLSKIIYAKSNYYRLRICKFLEFRKSDNNDKKNKNKNKNKNNVHSD